MFGPEVPMGYDVKAATPMMLLVLTTLAACGGAPSGFAKLSVDEDGAVTAYLTDEAGGIVYFENVYLQVRGERTRFNYAGSQGAVQTLCEQLPTSGPLEMRMTASFDVCPEVHVAAYFYDPPTETLRDGTKVTADDVPAAERCSTYQTLLHSTFWLPGGCEDVRTETAQ